MKHPSAATLALFAGHDLGWFAQRRTAQHVAQCPECRRELRAFTADRETLSDLDQFPAISWNRLSIEMKANIRLGLAAGECVRESRSPWAVPVAAFSAPRTWAACAAVTALIAAGLFLERSTPTAPLASAQGSLLRATANGIELDQGGETLSLRHARAENVVYTAGAQGSMRAGYVDSDTGNVTINNLYVQ